MRTRIELRVVILESERDRAEKLAEAIRETLNKHKVYNETLVDDDEEGEV